MMVTQFVRKRGPAVACSVAVLMGALSVSAARGQGPDSGANQVEVTLIKELTFDSEIQILRLKDGFPRLVVTEKTINWLDREGNVETRIANPTRAMGELQAEFAEGRESVLTSSVFASDNGDWVAIIDREYRRQLGLSTNRQLRLLDATGREVACFPVEPLCEAAVSNDGQLITVHGLRLGDERRPAPSRFVLYDRSGQELVSMPPVELDERWVGTVFVAFAGDSRHLAVLPKESSHRNVTLRVLRADGSVAWVAGLNSPRSTADFRRGPLAISNDGGRILATASASLGSDKLYAFTASGTLLGGPIQDLGPIHQLVATPKLTHALVRSGGTIRCFETDPFRQSWVWNSPWSPHRERIIEAQWTRSGRFAIVRTWFDPEFTEMRPLPPESTVVLDVRGREVWRGSLSGLSLARERCRGAGEDVFCVTGRTDLLVYEVRGRGDE